MRIVNVATAADIAAIKRKGRAHGHHAPGVMNKLEAAYAAELELQRRSGAVYSFAFEAEKLRLALRTFLTPDFRVVLADGATEFHEVKPRKARSKRFWAREDAWIKLKIAADRYPQHRFYVVWRVDGEWRKELVPRGEP